MIDREVVNRMVIKGGRRVRIESDEMWANLPPVPLAPYPCRYETMVTVYLIPPEKPYEAGPVPGSLW